MPVFSQHVAAPVAKMTSARFHMMAKAPRRHLNVAAAAKVKSKTPSAPSKDISPDPVKKSLLTASLYIAPAFLVISGKSAAVQGRLLLLLLLLVWVTISPPPPLYSI